MAHGIALINLGCRVNRVELDLMAESLLRMGCHIVEEDEAQAIVLTPVQLLLKQKLRREKLCVKQRLCPELLLWWQLVVLQAFLLKSLLLLPPMLL